MKSEENLKDSTRRSKVKSSRASRPNASTSPANTRNARTQRDASSTRPKALRGQRMKDGRVLKVRAFTLGDGGDLQQLREELDDMKAVLLGRVKPPVDTGITTLMEVSEAFHARAMEMAMEIHRGEANGEIMKSSGHYKFRTGELRDFTELCRRAMEMGSRRVTALQLELEHKLEPDFD